MKTSVPKEYDIGKLEAVFGEASSGNTPEVRATSSQAKFIRSQHQLTRFAEGARGRQLNATEALSLVGWELLSRFSEKDAVPFLYSRDEPYSSIIRRLQELHQDFDAVADTLGWSASLKRDFHNQEQIPFREWERLAAKLALDETKLGFEPLALEKSEIGKLADHFDNKGRINALDIYEKVWMLQKQESLARLINHVTGLSEMPRTSWWSEYLGTGKNRRAKYLEQWSRQLHVDLDEIQYPVAHVDVSYSEQAAIYVANNEFAGVIVTTPPYLSSTTFVRECFERAYKSLSSSTEASSTIEGGCAWFYKGTNMATSSATSVLFGMTDPSAVEFSDISRFRRHHSASSVFMYVVNVARQRSVISEDTAESLLEKSN